MSKDYYIIRCAYHFILRGRVSDAVVLLGQYLKWKEENYR